MTIYIGNLSFQAEQEHLFDLFSEYGEVKNCSLPLIERPDASAASRLSRWSTTKTNRKPSTTFKTLSGWAA